MFWLWVRAPPLFLEVRDLHLTQCVLGLHKCNGHLPSNGLSRVHECDIRQTTDDRERERERERETTLR